MTSISIELERDSGVYYAGEVVRGTVKLSCARQVKCRAFNIELTGSAKVHWHTGSGDNRRDYDGSTLYQQQRFTVKGNFHKTGLLDNAGADALFNVVQNMGVIQIPCSSHEQSSSVFQLIVRVMDYDWGKKDDLLGEFLLDVPALARAGEARSYPLTRKGRPEKGEATLSAKFLPYDAVFPTQTRTGAAISSEVSDNYCLELRVHKATGLRKADFGGRNDVYVQVYRPDQAKRDVVPGEKLPGPQKQVPLMGELVAPFAFPLRHDAPPSAEIGIRDRSHIRYAVRAYIDLANWRDPFSKRLITVVPNRPIPRPLLVSPHLIEAGPEPMTSRCGFGKYGFGSVKLNLDRVAYAPGEILDLSKSTATFEGKLKHDASVEIILEGHYKLSTSLSSVNARREYPIGQVKIPPNTTASIGQNFRVPHVYPSFWGGVSKKTQAHYPCLKWTYSLTMKLSGKTGSCSSSVQVSMPVLICSAPPYAKVLEQHQNQSPKQPASLNVWDIFQEAAVGTEEACTTAPTITGPEDVSQTINLGVPVNTYEGEGDNNNVGEGGKDTTNYQPIITTFNGPVSPSSDPLDHGVSNEESSLVELLRAMDEGFDKRLAVGKWTRDYPSQALRLTPEDFNVILKKVTFSLDQPPVVHELVAPYEGSSILKCAHIISAMRACDYQKKEVALIMAPFVGDPQNKESVLAELEYSFDKSSISEKFPSV